MKKNKDLFGDDSNETTIQDDFGALFEASELTSNQKLKVGDKISGEILTLGKEESFISTGTTTDGLVLTKELRDAEGNLSVKIGDRIELYVTQIKGQEIRLSKKQSGGDADSLEDAFDCMIPVDGKVTEVCNGGFRVNLMGKTAFCPISQMDSKPITEAADYVGKKFEFMITQFENRGRNIVVSRRKVLDQLKEESVAAFLEDRKVGELIKGIVTRIEPFGAFVEVAPSLEGLVHVSELSWSRVTDPNEVIKVGESLTVKILKIDDSNGGVKISLSYKQASEAPWDSASNRIKEGDVVTGTVTQCLKFGAFVQIVPGIEGLIPLSEMSYTKRVLRSDELIKPGDQVRVLIKSINADDRKILLSLKDADGDPWSLVPQNYPVGRIVKGTVDKKEHFGLLIRLEPGVVALLPKSAYRDSTDRSFENAKVGDELTFQVAEILFEDRRMRLSLPGDAEDSSWQDFQKTQNPASSSFANSIADQLKGFQVRK